MSTRTRRALRWSLLVAIATTIGLLVVLALVVAGYFLMTALHENANLEDCLMSGRRNCAPIEAPSPGR